MASRLLLCVLVPVCLGSLRAAQPNLVYIIADDLGYGDVSCLNPERGRISTPNIDRLAREGMIFTDAHSGSSVCTPTRYGVMTGRYAWRTRLQAGVLDGNLEPLIAADRLTVPALLRQQGYHTACIGKWHLGFTVKNGGEGKVPAVGAVTGDGPLTRGFDRFLGFQHARSMRAFYRDDEVAGEVKEINMLPALARAASDYVRERAQAGGPFFLYYALSSPHTPIVPGEEWQGKSGLGPYGDFVMQTDWAVGEVLKILDEKGLAESTLVLLTSDNGCSPQANVEELQAQGHFPSGEMRGYKSDIWEGGHRVPFIVRWPERVRAGAVNDALLCLTDWMATVADITAAELPPNAAEDSFSFLPELTGAGNSARTHAVHHSISGYFAIREGGSKLALCAGSGGWSPGREAGPVQLYDMEADLVERSDLAGSRPEEVARLTALLEEIVQRGRSTPGLDQSNDAPIELRKGDGVSKR